MSTFGGLNTAYRGLTAAQQAINLAGQNIANSATPGYTRQRIEQSAIGAPGRTGVNPGGAQAGQGVSVDGIARLGNTFLDAGVREICLVPHAYDPEQVERFAAEVRPLLGSLVAVA